MLTKTIALFGTDIYHVLFWFVCYCMMGWLVESIYMSICNKKITNRGFMYGPFCPIYGFGALMVYFLLRPISHNLVLTYFVGSLVATVFEFLTARLRQYLFGQVWWDYTDKPFNYRGILCLESTIAWGFYTIIMFQFLQRGVAWFTEQVPFAVGVRLLPAIYLVAVTDLVVHIMIAKKEYMPERIGNFLDNIQSLTTR